MVTMPEELIHLLTEWHTVPVEERHGFPESFSRHTWDEGKKMFVFLEAYAMRDERFVAEHRGGPLTRDHHRQLIRWARECSEHVISRMSGDIDQRLVHALSVAREWEQGKTATGVAMKASLGAHAVARESSDPVTIAVARSIGHAVATAHMADHSMGAALYALKAVNNAGKSVDTERGWQQEHLPPEIRELVMTAMNEKERHFKI